MTPIEPPSTHIRACFLMSVQQTLMSFSEADANTIRKDLLQMLGNYTAPYLFSPDLVKDVANTVFPNELLRDWLLNTQFVFFTNLAAVAGQSMVEFVMDNLARASSVDLGCEALLDEEELAHVQSVRVAPEQIIEELPTYRQARVILAANTWLMVILLTIAYLPMEHEILQPAGPEKKKTRIPLS